MLPIVKLRRRKSDSGSIGWRLRASQTMNEANSRAPPTSGTHTPGSAQPFRGCSISPNVIPASPNAHSAAPT